MVGGQGDNGVSPNAAVGQEEVESHRGSSREEMDEGSGGTGGCEAGCRPCQPPLLFLAGSLLVSVQACLNHNLVQAKDKVVQFLYVSFSQRTFLHILQGGGGRWWACFKWRGSQGLMYFLIGFS